MRQLVLSSAPLTKGLMCKIDDCLTGFGLGRCRGAL